MLRKRQAGEFSFQEVDRPMKSFAQDISKVGVWILILGLILLCGPMWARGADRPQSRLLELKPLPRQQIERLSKEARKQYSLGITAVDKINYEKGLTYFERSVESEPGNVYLRFLVVQLAQYLGDTGSGSDSIKYYEKAITNLQEMIRSPKLNAREKERAQNALDTMEGLRQTVSERDEKRQKYGVDMGKQYAKQVFKQDEKAKEKEQKQAKIEATVKKALNAPYIRTGPGESTPNYSVRESSRFATQ